MSTALYLGVRVVCYVRYSFSLAHPPYNTSDRPPIKVKGKGFLYSLGLPSVGPGADPGVQVTISHSLGGRLPLLSARPAVTCPALEHHRPYRPVPSYVILLGNRGT